MPAFYGLVVSAGLRGRRDLVYGELSTLAPKPREEAVHPFLETSIDLLHIDAPRNGS
jgi:hypothetical protein